MIQKINNGNIQMSLFGTRESDTKYPGWVFKQNNRNTDEDLKLLGQPKLMKTIKETTGAGNNYKRSKNRTSNKYFRWKSGHRSSI